MWEASWRTPNLVAEYGLIYDSSLMDADAPYVLETDHGAIAELPPFWGLDYWEQYAFLPRPVIGDQVRSPVVVAEAWIHELDAMRRHGAMFMLTCHPFISGRAGRIEALRIVIEAALERGDVVFRNAVGVATATLEAEDAQRRPLTPVTVSEEDFPEW
jgi:peptidoglycan/xylan/chitin deacetylase (PgdA/CDA1 family)